MGRGIADIRSLQKKHRPIVRIGVNYANFTGGHSEEGEGNSSLVNVSIFEEPSAVGSARYDL